MDLALKFTKPMTVDILKEIKIDYTSIGRYSVFYS